MSERQGGNYPKDAMKDLNNSINFVPISVGISSCTYLPTDFNLLELARISKVNGQGGRHPLAIAATASSNVSQP